MPKTHKLLRKKVLGKILKELILACSAERDRSGNRRQGGLRMGRSQSQQNSGTGPCINLILYVHKPYGILLKHLLKFKAVRE